MMGVSTNGQICYGILFDEDYDFPWQEGDEDDDIEHWWVYTVHGFKHSFELYTEAGDYIGGQRPAQDVLDRHYEEKHEFEKTIPGLPVELVNVCSCDYPQYILAVRGTEMTAYRGYPKVFNPASLTVTDEQKQALLDFCKAHNIEVPSEPEWYLSSLWC
jgi:hypothetical protein